MDFASSLVPSTYLTKRSGATNLERLLTSGWIFYCNYAAIILEQLQYVAFITDKVTKFHLNVRLAVTYTRKNNKEKV